MFLIANIFLLTSSIFSQEAIAGYLSTAIFTLLSVLIMFIIIKKFLFKPLDKILIQRQQQINNDLDNARADREKANILRQKAHEELAESNRKASEIVQQAKDLAIVQSENILKLAQEDANELISKAEEEAKYIKDNAYLEMRNEIADLSLAIASKVIAEKFDSKEDDELVQSILDQEIKNKSIQSEI